MRAAAPFGWLPAALGRATSTDRQAERLAEILGVRRVELASIRLGHRYFYRPVERPKRDGRTRRVLAPSAPLKQLQRRLLDGYLAGLPIHPSATAFRPGASAIVNARAHARAGLVATVDLCDFFDSTRADRVRGFFAALGWRGESLGVLLRLCTFGGGLPQGSPASPCLSNLVNTRLDERLCALAQRTRATYTRYGDDLAFSWTCGERPPGFERAVEDVLEARGYRVQPLKGWRVASIADRPVVTGLVLVGEGEVRVPRALRWRGFALRWRSWWTGDERTAAQAEGLRAYVSRVEGSGPAGRPTRIPRRQARRRAW